MIKIGGNIHFFSEDKIKRVIYMLYNIFSSKKHGAGANLSGRFFLKKWANKRETASKKTENESFFYSKETQRCIFAFKSKAYFWKRKPLPTGDNDDKLALGRTRGEMGG